MKHRHLICVFAIVAADIGGCGCQRTGRSFEDSDSVSEEFDESDAPTDTGGSQAQCAVVPNSVKDSYPCQCQSDCLAGAICLTEENTGVPQGICWRFCDPDSSSCQGDDFCDISASVYGVDSKACTGNCESITDCNSNEICIDGTCCFAGICSISCETNEDCPPARICDYPNGCYPHCTGDDDCLSKQCNLYTGKCGQEIPGYGLNRPCIRHDECKSQFCHPEFGFCGTNCSVEKQGCPENALCVPLDDFSDYGFCGRPCDVNTDCENDTFRCVLALDGNKVCGPSTMNNSCQAPAESIPDGTPCNCTEECYRGASCETEVQTGFPGGACIRLCSTDEDCYDGFHCRRAGASSDGWCSQACTTNNDCPPHRICVYGTCDPMCVEDSDCKNETCNLYTGTCDSFYLFGDGVMAACQTNSDCKSFFCEPIFGMCVTYCSVDAQSCPENALCLSLGDDSSDLGSCYFECNHDSDCEYLGMNCYPADEGLSVCLPL